MDNDTRLETWKEIASHLGVSPRTAQKLERDEGLPVHRLTSGGMVFAYPEEINEWVRTRSAEAKPSRPDAGEPQTRRRPHWKAGLLAGTLVLLIGSVGVWLLLRTSPKELVSCRIEEGVIYGLDSRDEILWKIPFPEWDQTFYMSDPVLRPPWFFVVEDGSPTEGVRVIVLLDDRGGHPILTGVTNSGERLWEVPISLPLRWNGEEFSTTFGLRLGGFARVEGRQRFFFVAVNEPRFPSRVVLLDPETGEIEGEYCHPGWLNGFVVHDFDQDGSDEMFLAGVNNPGPGPGHPALVALDLAETGRSQVSRDFFGRPSLAETAYVLFPRSRLAVALDSITMVDRIQLTADGRVAVSMLSGSTPNRQFGDFYALSPTLSILNFTMGDTHLEWSHRAVLGGLADPGVSFEEERSWLARLLRFESAPDGNDPAIPDLFENAPLCGGGEFPCREVLE